MKKDVRESAIAGSWYPGNKEELAAEVDGYLKKAAVYGLGEIRALVSPHAGYMYSGQVAATGYAQIRGKKYSTVVILSPCHNVSFQGIALTEKTAYETPLGLVGVSPKAGELRTKSKLISANEAADEREHSLEIQLPFLQRALSDFELIPLVIGRLSEKDREEIADLLAPLLGEDTLLVASSDLSHYFPYDTAIDLDRRCIEAIESLDIEAAEGCEMCGYNPVLITMELAKRLGWKTKTLEYKNSGDVTGDMSGVVGYASIAFYAGEAHEDKAEGFTPAEKRELLSLARDTIDKYVNEGRILEPATKNKKFMKKAAVFVTLEKAGELRGCIGHLQPVQPLYLDVRDNAIAAATQDPRFEAVSPEELEELEVEVSVLTEPALIPETNPEGYLEEIRKDVDGLILEYRGRSATYLPQVWEHFSRKEDFLSSLCQKAGLSTDSWKQKGAKIYRYQVHAFKESEAI